MDKLNHIKLSKAADFCIEQKLEGHSCNPDTAMLVGFMSRVLDLPQASVTGKLNPIVHRVSIRILLYPIIVPHCTSV